LGEKYPVPATVDGPHEQAVKRFAEFVRLYRPKRPMHPVRVRHYRTGDGRLVLAEGSSGRTYAYQFKLGEPEWDSGQIAY